MIFGNIGLMLVGFGAVDKNEVNTVGGNFSGTMSIVDNLK